MRNFQLANSKSTNSSQRFKNNDEGFKTKMKTKVDKLVERA